MSKRLVLFVLAISLVSAADAGISRYPYLQPTEDLGTSVAVMWQTDAKSGGTVRYGVQDVAEHSAEGAWQGENARHKHRYLAVLKDLKPGTVYQYQVESDGEKSAVHTFTTSSDADDFEFRAILISDTHSAPAGARNRWPGDLSKLVPELLAFKPQLVLHMGDFGIATADDAAFEASFKAGKDLWASSILCPVAGNHDTPSLIAKTLDLRVFADQFHLPANGPDPADPANPWLERVFGSFNYGRVHFVTVGAGLLPLTDSGVKDGPQWLQDDIDSALKSGKVANIVARTHVPGLPADALLRSNAALYLAGHVHVYCRTGASTPGEPGVFARPLPAYTPDMAGIVPVILPSIVYTGKDLPKYRWAVLTSALGYGEMTVTRGGRRIEVTVWAKDNRDLSGPRRQIDHFVIERSLLPADKNTGGP